MATKSAEKFSPLMVGPLGGTVSGQMSAFREAVDAIPTAVVLDAAFPSLIRILQYWARLAGAFRRSNGPVYITTSRSHRGFWLRDLPVFIGAALTQRPVINHLHGSDFLAFRSASYWPTSALVDWSYRRIVLACVTSPNLATQYAAYPKTAIRIVPNFYSTETLQTVVPKPRDGPTEVLYFSNFIASKGFVILCEAVELLRSLGNDVHLTLCGSIIGTDDMSATKVEAYLENVKQTGVATVREAVSGQDKIEVLSRAHIMVLPTRYPTEASPISLIEGLASGCYVISTDQGSIPQLLSGFDASIVDATRNEIAEAIAAYTRRTDQPELEIRNRQTAIERYAPERYRKTMKEIINAVAANYQRRCSKL